MSKYREKAAALAAQMNLEEKVGQTLYTAPAVERLGIPSYNWWNEALHGGKSGHGDGISAGNRHGGDI